MQHAHLHCCEPGYLPGASRTSKPLYPWPNQDSYADEIKNHTVRKDFHWPPVFQPVLSVPSYTSEDIYKYLPKEQSKSKFQFVQISRFEKLKRFSSSFMFYIHQNRNKMNTG